MSYCMFENTVGDLLQILNRLREVRDWEELTEEASDYEIQAMKDLPKVCKQIQDYYKYFQIEN